MLLKSRFTVFRTSLRAVFWTVFWFHVWLYSLNKWGYSTFKITDSCILTLDGIVKIVLKTISQLLADTKLIFLFHRIGCILLCIGQNDFYNEGLNTLKYVVNQSDYTVDTLRNVTEYLSLAKTISVAQVFLPSDVMTDIDKLNVDLNTAADTVAEKTSTNSHRITRVFIAMCVSSTCSFQSILCSFMMPKS